MSLFLENSLYEKGPFDACLMSRLILALLEFEKCDFLLLHACVIQGLPHREFPACAENRVIIFRQKPKFDYAIFFGFNNILVAFIFL